MAGLLINKNSQINKLFKTMLTYNFSIKYAILFFFKTFSLIIAILGVIIYIIQGDLFAVKIIAIIFSILLLPIVLLYIQYVIKSKDRILKIENDKLTFQINNNIETIFISDIIKVEHHLSPSRYGKGAIHLYMQDDFFYIVICTTDNKRICINSLLTRGELYSKHSIKVERFQHFYPFLPTDS